MPIESAQTARFTGNPFNYPILSGDVHQRAVRMVSERLKYGENFHKSQFERFYRYERLYNMVAKRKQADWRANAFLPYAFSIVEQSAAIKWLALMLTKPYVTVTARIAELEDVAARRGQILDWRFSGDLDLPTLSGTAFRQCERYGKSIIAIAPDWCSNTMVYRDYTELPTALGPQARIAWKSRDDNTYRLKAQVVDLTDFIGEPGKRRINGPDGMRWTILKRVKDYDELEEMEARQEIGIAVGGQPLSALTFGMPAEASENYKLRRSLMGSGGDLEQDKDPYARPVELSVFQGYVPRHGFVDPQIAEMEAQDGRDPFMRLIVIANRQTCLMNIALPWDHRMWGYVEMDTVPDPYEFWGRGKIQPAEHLLYVANEITNMRLDNVKQAVHGMIGVWGDRMPAGWKRRMMLQPWGIIETAGPINEAIGRINMGDVTASSYEEQQQLWTLIQETSAINETMMGAPGPSRTYGEHALKAESASKRLQFELVGQSQQLLAYPFGLSGFVTKLDRQYLPLPVYVGVVRPDSPDDFMTIKMRPSDFSADDRYFQYQPTGATEGINLAAKRSDLEQMIGALAPLLPMLLPMGFNVAELASTIIKTFGSDPKRFFPPLIGADSALQPGMGSPGDLPQGMGQGPGGAPMGPGGPGGLVPPDMGQMPGGMGQMPGGMGMGAPMGGGLPPPPPVMGREPTGGMMGMGPGMNPILSAIMSGRR